MNKGLRRAREAREEMVNSREGVKAQHNLLVKAKENPKSLRAAISASCFQCFGGTIDSLPDPGWKNEIRDCTAPDCALYHLRPYQKKEG